MTFQLNARQRLGLGGAVLLAIGAVGGAGAVSLTRPSVEMAPTVATPVTKLATSSGIVTVKGRVAEVFGDRFVVQDATGRALVNAGREGQNMVTKGSAVLVQGRYDNGQLRARFLVDAQGQVRELGPNGPPPPHGGPHGPGGRDAPPPPPPGAGAPPPPPPGAGAPPPPPPGADAPPPPAANAAPLPAPLPVPAGRQAEQTPAAARR